MPALIYGPDFALISDCVLNRKSNGCNSHISVIRLFIRRGGKSLRWALLCAAESEIKTIVANGALLRVLTLPR